jgi:hypothetical protein
VALFLTIALRVNGRYLRIELVGALLA